MDCPEAVETRRADNLFLKTLGKSRTLFVADEDVHSIDFRQTEKDLLEEHLAQEARGAGDQDTLAPVVLLDRHLQLSLSN